MPCQLDFDKMRVERHRWLDGRFHANHLAVRSAMPPSAHPAPFQSLFSAHQPGAKSNACSSGPCWPADDAPSPWPCDTRGRAIPRRSVSTIRCSIAPDGPPPDQVRSRLSKAVAVCWPCWCRPDAGRQPHVHRDMLRRLKPTASNMEVQRLQLPRRSWPVALLRPGVTPGTPEEHVSKIASALRSA